jgi:hypothetical protein
MTLLFGQNDEIFLHHKTGYNKNHCTSLIDHDITLYNDGTFIYTSNGWGKGSGDYIIKDSKVICTFGKKDTISHETYHSIENQVGGSQPSMLLLDRNQNEPLIGCQVTFYTANGDKTIRYVDIDGYVEFPNEDILSISISHTGFCPVSIEKVDTKSNYTIKTSPMEFNFLIAEGTVYKFQLYQDIYRNRKLAKID